MPAEQRKRVDRGIYKLGKDHYEVVVSTGWDPAKKRYGQKWERVHGTLTEARDVLARLRLEVKAGEHSGATTENDSDNEEGCERAFLVQQSLHHGSACWRPPSR